LQPANKHKQLIVIDFEYAAANVPGQEFANHFTEWTYNYHDQHRSWACNTERYPSPDQQKRFLKAYVEHRPQLARTGSTPQLQAADSQGGSGATTPSLGPTASTSSIVDFMLDARVPAGEYSAAERARDEQRDKQVRELMEETKLWRPANSAMWVAWGIVQAKVPGLDAADGEDAGHEAEEDMEADEFDYLSYAQDRARFFWGDCVRLGLVKAEELPEVLRANLKIVEY
jgi:choline kinase